MDKLEAEISHFNVKLEEAREKKTDRREKKYEEKEADRDQKIINFGVAINTLTEELAKERKVIEEEQRNGVYRFKNKVYVNYMDAGRRPPWKFTVTICGNSSGGVVARVFCDGERLLTPSIKAFCLGISYLL